jgi:predicted  nucleic acid-binding Zn-ribbon protein
MPTQLDKFHHELEALLKRYDYYLSSVREDIETHHKLLVSLHDTSPSIRSTMREINLEIRAVRLERI